MSMRVFVQIADRGSLSAASAALDISRAMTSRYLESLEEWLGVRLLHRTTRKLSLTDAGEQALQRCRDMVELSDEVKANASQAGEVQGRLRVTSSPSFAEAQLTAAVVEFQRLHPKVAVDLVTTDRTVDLVEDRIDLAVRISNRVDEGLVARRLATCHSLLCASPAYVELAGEPKVPSDLKTHQCIVNSTGFEPTYHLKSGGDVIAVDVRASLTANETSVVRAAVLAGAGIAMLPTYYVADDIATGTLCVILPEFTLEPMGVQAVYLSRRHQPHPLRLLIEFLAERFGGSVAPWDRAHGGLGLGKKLLA
ncbi:DNA-binding transcriptional LysR family regulator [Pseudorhodoferax soli]|uniref:DNA-binding transcriptional LysR family regulator n=2 Tax=Pseudorhodoferax soli TaxID=545864 RepID=A0A368XMW4_9BURK|nr:DNA-binding transcriptional LysR family regulator [Pseudorhodoferax soli]